MNRKMKRISKVAVLGAGTMGSQLAAHFANAGIPSLLYDLTPELTGKALSGLQKLKPAPFYSPRYSDTITPCHYVTDLERLAEVDWVIEGVVEDLQIKRELYQKIHSHLKPETVVSSNTSGLSLKDLTQEMPSELASRFLVTHFFNPPRYMHLLEIVSGEDTAPGITENLSLFAENILGKGVVRAKDTPNFIANRIGIFSLMLALKLAMEYDLTIEEVDKLTGPVIGHPKSATFRTADLVGLDVLARVAATSYEKGQSDEAREIFRVPRIITDLLRQNRLGAKTGQGFYRKVGKEILSLNFQTLEYEPRKKVAMDSLQKARKQPQLADKLSTLIAGSDVAGKFTWELLSQTFIYAASRIPEISDDLISIDNAMKWGFGWAQGPFETWETLGIERTLQRLNDEGKDIPAWVRDFYESGYRSFYRKKQTPLHYYDIPRRNYQPIKENHKVIHLDLLKNQGKKISGNSSASLIDLNDGILLLEFHSPLQPDLNPIDQDMLEIFEQGLVSIPDRGYKGLVIGNQGPNFTAGANLGLMLQLAEARNWKMLEKLSKIFQDITQKLRFTPFPVVAAPFQLCLGGGFELIGACDGRVASAELYCGLVETAIGIIPGGGGNLRLLQNNQKSMQSLRPGPFPPVQKTFETIAFAKVSSSAREAVFLGYLQKNDRIVINPRHVIYEAKQQVLHLAEDYQPPVCEKEISLPGENGRLAIEMMIDGYVRAGKISQHDALIAGKLAYVLTGGQRGGPLTPVDEQYLLDIEREAFVSLCAEPQTQQRMLHMLKTGKPLRN